jgi:putative ABC transport system substrate-binding protein
MRFTVLRLVMVLAVGFLIEVPTAEAQQRGQMPRVGILHPGAPPPAALSLVIEGLREGLREIGYVEGRTVALEYRWARGVPEALPGLAAELIGLRVDVLVAISLPAARAARDAAGAIPIVVTDLQIDPVASGLVTSFARPGGNITGLFLDLPGLTGKWLELVREATPSSRRVVVLWDSETGSDQVRAIKLAAQVLGMELQVLEVRSADDYDHVLRSALKGRPQALVQLSSPQARQASNRIADFALKNRLPAISMFRSFADSGGLLAYGPDLPIFFRRSATYVDRILKGAKPADLPIERPTKYELVVNSRTAKTLSLTLPASLLLRADEVIE